MAKKKSSRTYKAPSAEGKQLVIVESPSKARTINKYLGQDFVVLASVGHVRDLPSRNPKGVKAPVPGIDLEDRFRPTYEVLPGKNKALSELKRAAKQAREIWFATDLDREGEAIAWHLADEMGIDPAEAKRVIFSAITKSEIERAFNNPHPIDMDRVNAQQARRILDRLVGYQVSPLLWKKVARGLSAGRVQSVAVRLVVEREREIRAFIPDETWELAVNLTPDAAAAAGLVDAWTALRAERNEKGNPPSQKRRNAWLAERGAVRAELVKVGGEKFEPQVAGSLGEDAFASADAHDLTPQVLDVAALAGLTDASATTTEDPKGRGPARFVRTIEGRTDPDVPYAVDRIETKRTRSRPSAPFITSTLQQAASSKLGFAARRTMRTAQQLYEGIEIPGEGPVGLITYMRTDSTHLADDAIAMAREYIQGNHGDRYLPEKAPSYSSSNKAAQEAHEAIRPTSLRFPPKALAKALTADQLKLYELIWQRFLACQMTPAEWDSTTLWIEGGTDPQRKLTLKATGRALVFDGFYAVTGVPTASDEQTLPSMDEGQDLHPFAVEPRQRFSSPPPRFSEASLIKMLEAEGIGRPSTYASIIQVIQDRKYVELLQRRFYATDLGEVVTDKLVEAFPKILNVGYTRDMEAELDKIEEEHLDWIEMLESFHEPFSDALEHAMENLGHARAETQPAPEEYTCGECGSATVYRFGRNGRFLSCSKYPDCKWASPVDREGKPQPIQATFVACPKCGEAMIKRTGRFGPFLGCPRYGDKDDPCDGILNLDKQGKAVAPSRPPYTTDLKCPKCESPMNLRSGARGPWLGCSAFPKCRGRLSYAKLEDDVRQDLDKALAKHEKAHPIPIIKTVDGDALTDVQGKPLPDAPTPGQEVLETADAD